MKIIKIICDQCGDEITENKVGHDNDFCNRDCQDKYIGHQLKEVTLKDVDNIEEIGLSVRIMKISEKEISAGISGDHCLCDDPEKPNEGWVNVFARGRNKQQAKDNLREILRGKNLTILPKKKGQTTYTIYFLCE